MKKKRNLSELYKWSTHRNIAELIDENERQLIAKQVLHDYEADMASMSEWTLQHEKGEELLKPGKGNQSDPFEGAADYKSTLLQELAYEFGHRAEGELLSQEDLVLGNIVGPVNDEKETRSERVTTYMNWQLNDEMEDWREDRAALLARIGVAGTLFVKPSFDPLQKIPVTEVIKYPSFAINQHISSMKEAVCFTHLRDFTENQTITLRRMKYWLDIDLPLSEGTDKDNETDDKHDSPNVFLEQDCFYDLDGDDYEEPYTVTVHKGSGKLVRIVARYTPDDVMVVVEDDMAPMSALLEPKQDEYGILLDDNENPVMTIASEYAGKEIAQIEVPIDVIPYRFMRSLDGTFLGVGYYHLVAMRILGINTATNSLLNAGYLANCNGGLMSEDAFIKRGEQIINPGSYTPTAMNASEMNSAFMPFDFKEPSPTLLNLVEKLIVEVKELGTTIDLKDVVGTNVAASSILILMEEVGRARSSIMKNLARAMTKEFQALYRLNARYADAQMYQFITGDKEADYAADFSEQDVRVVPTADPEMDSNTKRMLRGEWSLNLLPQIKEAGGNDKVLINHVLHDMGLPYADEVMPLPDENSQEFIQKASQATEEAAIAEKDYWTAMAANESSKAELNTTKARAEKAMLMPKIQEIMATILLDKEKAETEAELNMTDKYTNHMEMLSGLLQTVLSAQPEGGQNAQATRP